MSEGQGEPQVGAPAEEAPPMSLEDRISEASGILSEILRRMGAPARFEFKEAADSTLLVAIHFEQEPPPGFDSGKRSSPLDSLQLLTNKILNRPGTSRRWLQLGLNAFPEPRPSREERQKAQAAARAAAQVAKSEAQAASRAAAATQAPQAAAQQPRAARPAREPQKQPQPRGEQDERSLEVPEDAALRAAAQSLAEKAAKHGRYFAVIATTPEERAQILQGSAGVEGVSVKPVGEGNLRRVVYTPANPIPLPKKAVMPDFDDEEED